MSQPQAMPSPMDQVDLAAVLQTLDEFRARVVEPRVARPEQVLSPREVAAITEEAEAAGLLPQPGEPGLGLWEDPGALALNLRMLAGLGQGCAGIAFHLHQLALARLVARRAGLPASGRTALLLLGRGGLARGALARWLGGERDAETAALVRDALPVLGERCAGLLVHAGEDFEELLAPVLEPDTLRVRWARWRRSELAVEPVAHRHGLDEVALFEVALPATVEPSLALEPEAAHPLLIELWGLHALGLVAIALGATRRALARAREYAGMRKQGGSLIGHHAAVQLLLGEASAAVGTVEAALAGVGPSPRNLETLAAAFRVRAVSHDLLCGGANAALQVFGGIGYMRDTGLEKLVRDNNHLRLLCGTPRELRLFLAQLEALP